MEKYALVFVFSMVLFIGIGLPSFLIASIKQKSLRNNLGWFYIVIAVVIGGAVTGEIKSFVECETVLGWFSLSFLSGMFLGCWIILSISDCFLNRKKQK